MDDLGAGLRVRDERLGSALVGEVGGDTGTDKGAGEPSFRRFGGLGWPAVGEGVGSVAAAVDADTGFTETGSAGLAGALDFADRR